MSLGVDQEEDLPRPVDLYVRLAPLPPLPRGTPAPPRQRCRPARHRPPRPTPAASPASPHPPSLAASTPCKPLAGGGGGAGAAAAEAQRLPAWGPPLSLPGHAKPPPPALPLNQR